MKFKYPLLLIIILKSSLSGFCVSDTTMLVRYNPEFRFTDGIFLNFEQVKKNAPVEKSRLLTTTDYNDRDFFTTLTVKNIISFYDNIGNKIDVPVKNIWGYADNGVLYININEIFYRITIVGSICHFVAYVTTYDYNPYNPYYNDYYSQRISSRNERTELKQFIIDFKSGKVLNYNTDNLEVVLMNDPELYDEYSSLRNQKKKQLKFLYMRKYNERNPLYFPNNK